MPGQKPFIYMLAQTKNNRWYPVFNINLALGEVTLATECGRTTYPVQWIKEFSIESARPIKVVPCHQNTNH